VRYGKRVQRVQFKGKICKGGVKNSQHEKTRKGYNGSRTLCASGTERSLSNPFRSDDEDAIGNSTPKVIQERLALIFTLDLYADGYFEPTTLEKHLCEHVEHSAKCVCAPVPHRM
jgi:hypothetical protein